jgi:hypothetical protein
MLKRCAIAGGVAAAIVAFIIVTLPCVVLIFGGATVWGAQNIEAAPYPERSDWSILELGFLTFHVVMRSTTHTEIVIN